MTRFVAKLASPPSITPLPINRKPPRTLNGILAPGRHLAPCESQSPESDGTRCTPARRRRRCHQCQPNSREHTHEKNTEPGPCIRILTEHIVDCHRIVLNDIRIDCL